MLFSSRTRAREGDSEFDTENSQNYVWGMEACDILGISTRSFRRHRSQGRFKGIRTAQYARGHLKYHIYDLFRFAYPYASQEQINEFIFEHISTRMDRKRRRLREKRGGRRENEMETAKEGQGENTRHEPAKRGPVRVQSDRESRVEEQRRKIKHLREVFNRKQAGLPEGDVPAGSSRSGELLDIFAKQRR